MPNQFEPFPKNPHLAQIFTLMGRSEESGTGTRNIYKYSKVYSESDNIQLLEEDVFISRVPLDETLFDELDRAKTDLKTDLKTDQIDLQIVELINSNPLISIPEIAKSINRTMTPTKNRIIKLKEKGLIQREGPDKGGYWKIIEKQ